MDNGTNLPSRRQELERPGYGTSELFETLCGEQNRQGASIDAPFPTTDVGNAERLYEALHDRLRWVSDQERWMEWDGKRWRRCHGNEEVIGAARDVLRSIHREAGPLQGKQRDEMLKHAKSSQSRAAIQNAVKLFRSEGVTDGRDDLRGRISRSSAEFDAAPYLLNTPSGKLDLRTGLAEATSPRDMVSKLTGAEFRGADYRDQGWERFIEECFPDPDVRDYVQRLFGYCLTGDVSEEVMPYFLGPTSTGKSTFLEAIGATMGDYAMASQRKLLIEMANKSGSDDVDDIRGFRLVRYVEVQRGHKLNEGLVKQLTGGDVLRARALYARSSEFKSTAKIVVAANDRLQASADDDAIWRRIHQIPMEVQVPAEKRDPLLKERLTTDPDALAGVLSWAVRGSQAWYRNRIDGTHTTGLRPPAAITDATAAYRAEVDPLREFVEEHLELAPSAKTYTTELREAYTESCKRAGRTRMTDIAFSKSLQARGLEIGRDGSGRFYRGARLNASGRNLVGQRGLSIS